jgi:hypothetical protein
LRARRRGRARPAYASAGPQSHTPAGSDNGGPDTYEGIPDADEHAALDILTLEERDGRTLLAVLVEHPTKQGRDMHIESGMEDGMQDAMDLLEQVAVSLR